MSNSVPSRLHLTGQAFGFGASDRRTPTPSSISQHGTSAMSNRRNSQLRSSLTEAPGSRMAMSSAMGVGSSTMGQVGANTGQGHTEGSVVSFEWPIAGWSTLGRTPPAGAQGEDAEDEEIDRPDILQRGIIFGDGLYKVDIAADSGQDPFENTLESPIALSIFLSCLTVESAPVEYSFSTTIFAGIRPAHVDIGQKYAETHWAWHVHLTHEFSRETDYARIALPDYTTVLLPQIAGEWILVLRVTCPPISSTLGQEQSGADGRRELDWIEPGQIAVPRDVMSGLADLLDSPSGDVQFVCLEHVREGCSEGEEGEDRVVSRKRIIYAHSEILKSRSAYFRMLLEGGFKETEGLAKRTVLVDDAGYDTVYWLLRFIYCNALTFATEDDVRMITDISSLDRKAVHKVLEGKEQTLRRHHWSPPPPGEWDFRAIPLDSGSESGDAMSAAMSMSMTLSEADGHSVSEASAFSGGLSGGKRAADAGAGRRSSVGEAVSRGDVDQTRGSIRPIRSGTATTAGGLPSVPRRRGAPPSSMASTSTATPTKDSTSRSANSVRPGRQPVSGSNAKASMTTSPIGPKQTLSSAPPRPIRLSDVAQIPDPHSHPAPAPSYPSALAMYLLSHRYDIPVLQALAKERILKGLTPDACMPMLLATHAYDSLHAEVLDFVIDYFGTIQTTPQFRTAVKEVSSGQWGAAGGDVLLGLFQRL